MISNFQQGSNGSKPGSSSLDGSLRQRFVEAGPGLGLLDVFHAVAGGSHVPCTCVNQPFFLKLRSISYIHEKE